MIRLSAWIAVLTAIGFLWQECGEDLGVFCYRIGCSVFTFTRKRTLALMPVRHTPSGKFPRTNAACSTRYFTFSNLCTPRRGFKS